MKTASLTEKVRSINQGNLIVNITDNERFYAKVHEQGNYYVIKRHINTTDPHKLTIFIEDLIREYKESNVSQHRYFMVNEYMKTHLMILGKEYCLVDYSTQDYTVQANLIIASIPSWLKSLGIGINFSFSFTNGILTSVCNTIYVIEYIAINELETMIKYKVITI
jgi:hypothetical protein